MQHTYAAIDARCDQGHLSAGFFPYHRALVLAVEASVLAVDPGVGALPYWDYNVDLALPDPAASEIWSDAFFGEAAGDPDDAYMIRTGPWKDWTVDRGDLFAGPPLRASSFFFSSAAFLKSSCCTAAFSCVINELTSASAAARSTRRCRRRAGGRNAFINAAWARSRHHRFIVSSSAATAPRVLRPLVRFSLLC